MNSQLVKNGGATIANIASKCDTDNHISGDNQQHLLNTNDDFSVENFLGVLEDKLRTSLLAGKFIEITVGQGGGRRKTRRKRKLNKRRRTVRTGRRRY
jgi:hypothetical protein